MQSTSQSVETVAGPREWLTGAVDLEAVAPAAGPPDAARRDQPSADAATARLVRRPARRPRIVWPARGLALSSRPTRVDPWRRSHATPPAAGPR